MAVPLPFPRAFSILRQWRPWLRVAGLWFLHQLPGPLRLMLGTWNGGRRYQRDHEGRVRLERKLRLSLRRAGLELRARIARRHYQQQAQCRLDHGLLWWGSVDEWNRRVSIEGEEHLRPLVDAGHPVILFTVPHVAQEFAAMAFHRRYFTALSVAGGGGELEQRLIIRARRRSGGVVLAGENLMQLVRMVREGHLLIHPMGAGELSSTSKAAPFFGAAAELSLSVARLARLCHAAVVPYMVHHREGRYVVRLFPAIRLGPRSQERANVLRLGAARERMTAVAPEQLLWSEVALLETVREAGNVTGMVQAPGSCARLHSGPW